MSQHLSYSEPSQIRRAYERNGYVCPIPIMTASEMGAVRARLDNYLRTSKYDTKDDPYLQFKVHFVFEWADELVRHPAALDAVETLIGPDILVWNTAVLIKKPQKQDFVSWHQDTYYWGNRPEDVVSAWIALADSTPENGCVRAIPGSHKWGVLPHQDTFGKDNMLSRGQRITREIDEKQAVDMALKAGEMSLHHTRTVHGSAPNLAGPTRMGFVVTYMTPNTQMIGPRTGATLVRGADRGGHFDIETVRPGVDLDPACLAAHEAAMRPIKAALYEGAAKKERSGEQSK